jgi:hypothetical protein
MLFISTASFAQVSSYPNCGSPHSISVAQLQTWGKETYSKLDPTGGFNSLNSDACKPMAQSAQKSVLRMLLPAAEMKSIRELFGDDGPEFRKKLIQQIKADTSPPPSTNDINIWQIEQCLQKQSTECLISTAYRSSTVVLTGDGTTSATAFHNLKIFLGPQLNDALRKGMTPEQAADLINKTPVTAFLYNSNGQLIGSPTDLSLHPQGITAAQIMAAWQNPNSKEMPAFSDKASLSFSRRLGPGVTIAKDAPKLNEPTLMFGFPDETTAWNSYGENDSDGTSMYCTVGRVISAEDAAKRSGWDFEHLNIYERQLYQEQVLFTSANSFGGMSGGPTFNSKGELVSVHSRGNNVPLSSETANALVVSGR